MELKLELKAEVKMVKLPRDIRLMVKLEEMNPGMYRAGLIDFECLALTHFMATAPTLPEAIARLFDLMARHMRDLPKF